MLRRWLKWKQGQASVNVALKQTQAYCPLHRSPLQPHALKDPVPVDQQMLEAGSGMQDDQGDKYPHKRFVYFKKLFGRVMVGSAPCRQADAEENYSALAVCRSQKTGDRQQQH